MNYVNQNIKKTYMNNSIGLILCREDNQIILKYSTDKRIFSSSYKFINK